MIPLVVLLALPGPAVQAQVPPAGLWAGYQEVQGFQVLPVMGKVATRSRTWLLATLAPTPDGGFTLTERGCMVDFKPVLGVQVEMPAATVARLPTTLATFQVEGADFVAPGWQAGWGTEDVDGDGHPGVTLSVRAPLCGGQLYVASTATTRARARMHEGALEARIAIDVEQTMLGAEGACLREVASNETQHLTGWLRLVPVPAGTTCPTDPAVWPALPKQAPER